jgi:hypothetical protein
LVFEVLGEGEAVDLELFLEDALAFVEGLDEVGELG